MKKISIRFENCYGIRNLKYSFDFSNGCTIYSLYSPNGVMKTSFAKTFRDLSQNTDSRDLVFPDRVTKREITVENNKDLNGENVFVVEPYIESFKSKKISTLLVNPSLRSDYEEIHSEIDDQKNKLLDELKNLSGVKLNIEDTIARAFTNIPNSFFTVLLRIENEVKANQNNFEGIRYSSIFNEKVESVLNDPSLRKDLLDYVSKYSDLLDASNFFRRGIFNHTNANTIAKNLKDNGFFKAKHTILLNGKNGSEEIKTEKQLIEVIEKEKNSILENPELLKAFDVIDKKISANKELRDFRDIITENHGILNELLTPDALKEKLWIYYLAFRIDLYSALIETYKSGRGKIESIVLQAKQERTTWLEVVDIFNKRFSVPFKLSIGNQDQVILNDSAPIIKFEFSDESNTAPVDEQALLKVLSTGEKRALYLLNIIFEVQARMKSSTPTVFIIDDIADSFDYKNKYAIVEYLKDIAECDFFYQITLTHNFDFFRTIGSRLNVHRKNRLITEKCIDSIALIEEKYQKNPLIHWKRNLSREPSMLIAAIPLARNLAEYSGDESRFNKLTSLLHYKNDTLTISVRKLEDHYRNIFSDLTNLDLSHIPGTVFDLVILTATDISNSLDDNIDLEKKIVLSIAIRLAAERYMVEQIADDPFWHGITENQGITLYKKYKSMFPSNTEILQVLQQVNLMTPENIHINSFMYEPILDMSNHHLKTLFSKVKVMYNSLPSQALHITQ